VNRKLTSWPKLFVMSTKGRYSTRTRLKPINMQWLEKRALNKNLEKCAYYAAFWKATNSVLVAAKRCAFSSK